MVSIPSYDNNKFSQGIKAEDYEAILNDEENPMLNRAISGIYPSGSIIKPVIAAAGLDQGVISEDTTINDPGEIKIGEWVFPDWKNHGIVDVKKAIAVSCNVFFYAIGGGWENIKGLGVDLIDQYLDRFGFGKTSGIELTGEAEGNIPTPEWKEEVKGEPWYLGDTYHLAIGQGDFLVTPLQMANALVGIANGGTLYKPHFVSKVIDPEGNTVKEFDAEVLSDSLVDNDYSIEVVRQGMRQSVDSDTGSSRQLQDLPVSAGGKTGTAQYDASDLERYHAWFTAFAPYDNPEIAIVVLVEKGGEGNEVAEPVANEILKYYFENKDKKEEE
jgi:penicillin-binding protein 2